MIDYIDTLTRKYDKKVASFEFKNFVVLQNQDILFEKLTNSQLLPDTFVLKKAYKKLEYANDDRACHLRFLINDSLNSTKEYYGSFKRLFKFIKCLNRSVLESKTRFLKSEWRRPLLALINTRFGKAISNTDFVFSLNPHSATRSQIANGKISQNVAVKFGYVSHFRRMDLSTTSASARKANFHYLEYPIDNLKFDVEYFLFLVRNYKLFV
jgi:hypothetical protein